MPMRRVEHEHLDQRVVAYEVGGVPVVRQDAADLRGGEEDELGTLRGEEALDVLLPGQVDLGTRRKEQVVEAVLPESSHDGGADEPAVPGNPDARVTRHRQDVACRS